MADITVFVSKSIEPVDFLADNTDDDIVDFITELDLRNGDSGFSLNLVAALLNTWTKEDFEGNELELSELIEKLEEIRGY